MNPISPLQQQFPLSPRKFWKKMLNQIVGIAFVALILGVVSGFAIYFGWSFLTFKPGDNPSYTPLVLLIIGMVIAFFVVHVGLYSWYIKAYIKRYYYAGEEHFITIKKGVFTPAEIHVQYQKIQDVYVDQDLLDRMMGLYDVHIASATVASGIEAHIDGVDHATAEGLKQFFLSKLSGISAQNNANATAAVGVQSQSVPQAQRAAVVVKLSEEISNKTYPLSDKWFAIKILGCIGSPFIYWAFLFFIFSAKLGKDIPSDYNGYYLPGYIVVVILSIIFHIASFLLWKKNYAFDFTPENIYYRQGVIAISEKHMPYSSIQDVTVQQSFLERILGLAKVRIENAAQQQMVPTRKGAVAVFNGVLLQGISLADANKITDIIKTTVLGRNSSQYGL